MTTDKRGNSIDAAYLNALRLGPQRIGRASVGSTGIPLPVARRLAATGRAVVVGDEVRSIKAAALQGPPTD
ncbi:hypothetical protein LQT97_14955 [Brucella pseudogrignonensis]|uniref:hypothetical protein n=1 Tax=Brucella pseudogrignonensis TaxID=419475 RepID=UPI001E33E9D1|nr:hypothetical protein [Brucella pseudogrignonensis]MCD4512524.1 hypothetical protein [Brucella pseudogrignonensis]